MLRVLSVLAFFTSPMCCAPAHAKALLIGGHEAIRGDYPEILYMTASDSEGGWSCSGTVIGPSVYLTAAHCAASGQKIKGYDGSWKAVCTRHPSYSDDDNEQAVDISVCKRSDGRSWSMKPAIIAEEGPALGDIVTLAGYGCTASNGGGGNNGILKVGEAPVRQLDAVDDYWFYTVGSDALCYGDSGGPSFKRIVAPRSDYHEVLGVNSRGDIKTLSMLAPVYIDLSRQFLLDFAKQHKVKICGVSDDCY